MAARTLYPSLGYLYARRISRDIQMSPLFQTNVRLEGCLAERKIFTQCFYPKDAKNIRVWIGR